jgi:hypothetical protein
MRLAIFPQDKLTGAKLFLGSFLVLLSAKGVARMLTWPLVGDASLMHYVVFLIQHGFAPYREIQEMNMPGAYFVDWSVMNTLGGGAIAWHIFDLAVIIAVFVAGILIARGYDVFAGIFACSLFAVIHLRDGMTQSGQRDLSIAALMLGAYCLFFSALRSGTKWQVFWSGLLACFAVLIKPVALPLALALLVLALVELHRREQATSRHILLWLGGGCVPLLALGIMLGHWHNCHAFFNTLSQLDPYHAEMARLPLRTLLSRLASQILPLVIGAIILLPVSLKLFRNWEYSALLAASLLGAFSYLIQGKGYSYQRYPFEIFALLIIGLFLTNALHQTGWPRWLAGTLLLYGCLVVAPVSAAKALRYNADQDDFGALLKQDIQSLGGAKLDRKVQCLDTYSGCVRVLYDLKLVQSTGFMYDEFLFGPERSGVIAASRDRFWQQLQTNPPDVFIVTDQAYPSLQTNLNKTDSWPLLADDLRQNYGVYVERHPTRRQSWEGDPYLPAAYRIYVRRR